MLLVDCLAQHADQLDFLVKVALGKHNLDVLCNMLGIKQLCVVSTHCVLVVCVDNTLGHAVRHVVAARQVWLAWLAWLAWLVFQTLHFFEWSVEYISPHVNTSEFGFVWSGWSTDNSWHNVV